MQKRSYTRILSLLLAVLLVAAVCPLQADAAVVTITDAVEKAAYLDKFNRAVNAVKDDRPGFTITATGSVKQDEDADEMASDWISLLVNNVFISENSLTADVFSMLGSSEDEDSDENTKKATQVYGKGEDNRPKTPVAGADYVSKLTTDTAFTMKTLYNATKKTTEILIQFPECSLKDALKSELATVFDLPTSTDIKLTDEITGVIEGGVFSLKDVTLTNAYLDIILNEDGQLTTYTSNINYKVRVGMFGLLDALPDFVLKLFGLGAINIGKPVSMICNIIGKFVDFDPDSAMADSDNIVDYAVQYTMSGFDWTTRYFGDMDYDNDVTASDARILLRASVNLITLTSQGDNTFGDMDFDGVISAADARLALRISVKLEKKFKSYSQRKAQLNGTWVDPDEPDEPVTPIEPEIPEIPIVF